MKAWKALEQAAASLFNGKRFWANSGERLDFRGYIERRIYGSYGLVVNTEPIRGQCKLVKNLSLEALTKLAEEENVNVVCVKVRRGKGKPSPMLVVFTEENYRRLHCDTTSSTSTVGPCASSALSPTSRLSENTSHLPSGQPVSSGLSALGSYLVNPRSLPGQLPL